MEVELPEHLRPSQAVETVKVGVVSEISSENTAFKYEDLVKVGQELGVITLSSNIMGSLEKAGTELESIGLVKVANGSAYVSAAALLPVMLKLVQDALTATKTSDRVKIAQVLASLTAAIDKQNRTLKMDQPVVSHMPTSRHNGPAPGQHVHFHTHEAPPVRP